MALLTCIWTIETATFTHTENNSYLLNTTLSTTNLSKIRIDESWPNLRVECSRDKIFFQSYSRHYVTVYRRQISRIPFLIHTIALKSFRAAKFRANERTKQNRFYGLQWIDIIENEQCGISFDHDRIWDRQTSKFYLQHGTPTFYDHKLQNWQPSRTFMMEWRANSRAHSGGRPLNYSRTPFTREQINASNN